MASWKKASYSIEMAAAAPGKPDGQTANSMTQLLVGYGIVPQHKISRRIHFQL